ncbi:ABC transporter permease [Paenibacillus thermoaerophilus]|uniref:ABC transporter permease n=1 Tax=Paenibacillus thermoaerophilus TaxID=1215385 RepID=A0ABW2V7E7_9BACL|nr:FtsX-like permease family protein [Paenibacillus thermoaerophilus]TMV11993.1 ABC transporter permease [Paenibacillus thermoaerophilus]
MTFRDQLRFVRQNVKKNKTRLFMTVLATAMGCAFLIVLASVGFGLQKSIVDDMVGDRLVTEIEVWGVMPEGEEKVNNDLRDEHISYLKSVEHVKAVTTRNRVRQSLEPTVDGTVLTTFGAIAVDFDEESKAGMELDAGRFPQATNEIVVGYHIRKTDQQDQPQYDEVPPAKEWLGKTVRLTVKQRSADGGETSTPIEAAIVGVTKKPSKEWEEDRLLYIGSGMLDEVERITQTRLGEIREAGGNSGAPRDLAADLSQPRTYESVKVVADRLDHVKSIASEIRSKGYLNHSIVDMLEQTNLFFLIMKIGLVFVGTIAVLIASIGIFNTMTMAVTERAQDIGIMKAIGAHPSVIRRIFLLESAVIGLSGAVIGTIVSYGLSHAVNWGLPVLVKMVMDEKVPDNFVFSLIPPYLVMIACAISLGVAVLSGMRPAARATRVDVLRALRRDV